MKKLFILLLALGTTQTHAAQQQKTITVNNSTTQVVDFMLHCGNSKRRETKKLVPGKNIEFKVNCAPTAAKIQFSLGSVTAGDSNELVEGFGSTQVNPKELKALNNKDKLSFEIYNYDPASTQAIAIRVK